VTSIFDATATLLIGANTNAGSAVFLIRAEPSAPGADIPMPHLWFQITNDRAVAQRRIEGGTVAVGGTPSYGRSLYRADCIVTAVPDTFGQSHTVIEQLRPKLDGWNGVAAGLSVDGIYVQQREVDYSVPDEVGSEQLVLDIWYKV
jgi:hypothetical protein